MVKKLMVLLVATSTCLAAFPVLAAVESCKVQVAVSTPPVMANQNVAFNITSSTNKSLTLKGGDAPQIIDGLACGSDIGYTISATLYDAPAKNPKKNAPIGQCVLKAGTVTLAFPGDSIAVVFPQDFSC